MKAFDLADKYRNARHDAGRRRHRPDDGAGEHARVQARATRPTRPGPPPAGMHGCGRERAIINSLYIEPERLEEHGEQAVGQVRGDRSRTSAAGGTAVHGGRRVCAWSPTAPPPASPAPPCASAREQGMKVGLIRPITLWPFPNEAIRRRRHTAQGRPDAWKCPWARWSTTCAWP